MSQHFTFQVKIQSLGELLKEMTNSLFRYQKLSHPLKDEDRGWEEGFMSVPRCFSYRDGNILVAEHQRMGTLLDLVNLTKSADKQIIEPLRLEIRSHKLVLRRRRIQTLPEGVTALVLPILT